MDDAGQLATREEVMLEEPPAWNPAAVRVAQSLPPKPARVAGRFEERLPRRGAARGSDTVPGRCREAGRCGPKDPRRRPAPAHMPASRAQPRRSGGKDL